MTGRVPLALITQDFPPRTGGVQTYSYELAHKLAATFQVTVIAPWSSTASIIDRQLPFPVYRLPHLSPATFGLTTLAAIPILSGKLGFRTVLHAQYGAALGSLLAQRLGRLDRYYLAAHGRELRYNPWGPLSTTNRHLSLHNAARIFAVSAYTRELLHDTGVDRKKVEVVPNGVNATLFSPGCRQTARTQLGLDGNPLLLAGGRLVRRKGIDTVIGALDLLGHRWPAVQLIVFGDGPDRQRLKRLAADHMECGRVRFVGRVKKDQLVRYYQAADIYLMPAREERNGGVEGFGLVFLEAGACGTPVIGGISGGIPEVVKNGVNGFLVPPDDPEGLARAIVSICTNPELAKRLAQGGRRQARMYSWDRSAAQITRIISKNLTGRS